MKKWMEGNLPRRGLAMALCLCMVLSLMPLSAFAEEEPAGTTVQETTVPEETVPETTVPEVSVPETTVPEETVPETTVPEETVPETTVPEETVPETTVPEETVPETTVPEVTVPETTVPEETVPETTVPEETVPETTVPEATAPSHDCDGELEPAEGDQGEALWVCPVCGAVLDAQGNALPPLLSDCSAYGAQAVGVRIDGTNFPDKNFRAIVWEHDKDGDGALSTAEIAAVDKIDCFEGGISSLKGIEYFTALTELRCDKNQLTSLDVSSNTGLTELNCSNNQLTSLDVSSNRDLTQLRCYNNQLASLDVSSNPALQELDCADNALTSLDLSKNTALRGANFYGQKASGDYIQRDGAYLLDMAKVVGTSNLSRVSVTSGGTYDDSTGMVTLNAPTGEDNTIEVKYNYTVGFNANTMSVSDPDAPRHPQL